jgi:5-formyltetrahydrofolate cyclo-ligase
MVCGGAVGDAPSFGLFMSFPSLAELRRAMRGRRRALSLTQRRVCALTAARRVAATAWFGRSRRIAFYLANDGELDPQPLMERAWAMGKECFLPVLRPIGDDRLWFARYEPGDPLRPNRFNIPEPIARYGRGVAPWSLDLVLMPLVAFDARGNRVGMGGGFYDRTLAYLGRRKIWQRPRLLGLAYEFQRVDGLSPRPWDVPLQAVATERGVVGRDLQAD